MSKTTNYKRMERLVKEYRQSGQGQAAFAQAHGITESKLYYWLRKLGEPTCGKAESATEKPSGFIPVSTTKPASAKATSMIIRIGEGITIEIPVSCLR
ncbi:IS66 family insertion sequence element accessory protein TnpA [Sinomicrobium soli]|uniref:IS66 family insertion sequence element accessory protein TnpA n=1 Tax=Sinomicrobium sp. N-1-3-6 TaxID=2219864 RepID=UPI000DCC6B88|nr:hypothetical protein [Sinomicrobium sp. N-1-3-6]RAV27394.1 hypothetical protein DN748_18880 [Sinomicrobium sp. N-1-3-6]